MRLRARPQPQPLQLVRAPYCPPLLLHCSTYYEHLPRGGVPDAAQAIVRARDLVRVRIRVGVRVRVRVRVRVWVRVGAGFRLRVRARGGAAPLGVGGTATYLLVAQPRATRPAVEGEVAVDAAQGPLTLDLRHTARRDSASAQQRVGGWRAERVVRAARHAWRPQPAHESVKMWKARRQSSTSAVAAGAIILSATGLSPTCGKQLRQHQGPLPVRRKASARASPQHDSVAWNQAAQLSHTTPNSTTCARDSTGVGSTGVGTIGAALTFLQTGHMHASAERWERRRIPSHSGIVFPCD